MPLLHSRATAQTFQPAMLAVMVVIHLVAIAAIFTFSWQGLIAFFIMSFVTGCFGITLCYHRLLSHKSYKAHPAIRNFLMLCGVLALQGDPSWWTATHRLHHREADQDLDPHSPSVSFAWSHMLWLFFTNPRLEKEDCKHKLIPDLINDPWARFLEKAFLPINLLFLLALYGLGYAMGGVKMGLSLLAWGGFLRIVWVWHTTWFVNSVTHIFGYQNYKVRDDSLNLWWVALLTFGEGWHNNHHAYPASARSGHRWWEVDITYGLITLLKWTGLATRIVPLPAKKPVPVTATITPLPPINARVVAK
jgi:fatty-acid desaturase